MVIEALIGTIPVFAAVKAVMSPVPVDARPMATLSLVHVKVAPGPTGLETGVNGAATLLQKVWFGIGLIVGVGFTVMEYVKGVPVQALAVGVIVMEALIGEIPALEAVKAGIFPVPLAARPINVLLLVQEKVVPAPTGLLTGVIGAPIVLQ